MTDTGSTDRQDFWADAEVIHRYTRAQALADGVLVEVPTHLALEAGLRWSVALTAAAWADAVAWTPATEQAKPSDTGQDETGRLWDVLTMTRLSAAQHGQQHRRPVRVLRVPASGRGLQPRLTTLHLIAGPGDDGEPVLTLMLPGED